MNSITNQLENIKQILCMPSSQIPQQRFPFSTFLMGALYIKSPNISVIKDFIETLENLVLNKKILQKEEISILNSVYDNMELVEKIETNILEKIDMGENLKIQSQLKKILDIPLKSQQRSQIQNTNQLNQSQNTIQGEEQQIVHYEQQKQLLQLKKKKEDEQRISLELIKKLQQQQSNKMPQDQVQCQICLDSLYSANFIPFDTCKHIFHVDCLRESYKISISQRKFPLICPNEECGIAISDINIRQILDYQNYQQYMQITFKNYVDLNNDTVSWCPTADCKQVFFYSDQNQIRYECRQCRKQYCLKCRSDWHKKMTCKQHQITNTFNQDDQKFINFVKGAKFKQCPKCRFWVEKNKGCDHMSCRCGNQFCYKCGGKHGDCECMRQAREKQQHRLQIQEARLRKKKQNEEKKLRKLLQRQNKKKQVQVQFQSQIKKTRKSTRKR